MIEKPPFAGSYKDRHGKTRWRFRRAGKTIQLPGEPGDSAFDLAYQAALAGQAVPRRATVHRLPTAASPQSLKAAWRILKNHDPDWKALDPQTQQTQSSIVERFLRSPVVEGEPLLFESVAMPDLRRKHIKAILARHSATPHAAHHLLRMIRKLIAVAIDEEWIENDPTYRIAKRPGYVGWKAWPAPVRAAYEARWSVGTMPRTVYALALYFGHRRSDVARVRWTDFEAAGSNVVQKKTGKALWLPMLPELVEALEATPRKSEFVVLTKFGSPFSVKSLSMRMREWTDAAGIPQGYTLHGLRKTLGKMLAEGGATTRQIMAVLGHDDIAHAELYTREAEQRSLAVEAISKLLKRAG